MRCAVVTPYHTEPLSMLRRAHDSVRSQGVAVTHVLVADGHPRDELDSWEAVHLRLPASHGDNGNTPRSAGARWALAQGFDQITFLDADNWYLKGHLPGLQALATATQADVLISGRVVVAPDGRRLPTAHHTSVRAGGHADTSTVLLQARGLSLADCWDQMPTKLSPMCDQVFCHAARARGLSFAQTPAETLVFTSRYSPHFLSAGLAPPPDCRAMGSLTRATQVWRRLRPSVRDAILQGTALPSEPARAPVTVLLALPDTLPSAQLAVLQALAAAAGPRFSLQRVAPPAGVSMDRYTAQLLAQTGPDWRARVLVLAASATPQGRALQHAALASVLPEQDWQRPRLLVLQPGAVSTPPLEADRLQQEAWRVVALTSAHKERFHAHCPAGDGHVVNASNPDEVAALVSDAVNAPCDALAAAPDGG